MWCQGKGGRRSGERRGEGRGGGGGTRVQMHEEALNRGGQGSTMAGKGLGFRVSGLEARAGQGLGFGV